MSPTRQRQASLDEICAQAVDLARSAAAEIAGPDRVGPHAGVQAEGDRIATHLFACLEPAYAGWQWAVTVSRASRARVATVSEAVLLPGPGSLLAPAWVPWSSRVRPGDLGVGDLLPADSDDERLVPVVALEGDDGMLDWDDGTDPAAAGSGLAVPAPAAAGQPGRGRAGRRGHRGPLPDPVGHRPGRGGPALVCQRARAGHTAGQRRARALSQLRVPGPAERAAGPDFRRVRQ